jgi:DNA-binding NarL/FixJ family response regulator
MALRIVRSKDPFPRHKGAGRPRTAETGKPIPVYMAEQNYLAAQYLRQVLEEDSTLRPMSLEDLVVETPGPYPVSVFVVDRGGINLPLSECLHLLAERRAEARFLVLDEDRSQQELVELLALGIHGFVSYRQISEQLRQAVHAVAEDKMWVPPGVLESYVHHSVASRRGVSTALSARGITGREGQVMELVRRRLSNKEIAETLNIKESTVKFHLSNIFSKLAVKRRRQLQDIGHANAIWKKLMAS